MSRLTIILLIAITLCVGCERRSGSINTEGPFRDTNGDVLSNAIYLHYNCDFPETINLLVNGETRTSVEISGKGNWKIIATDEALIVAADEELLRLPISVEGVLDSTPEVNDANQMVFDITISGTSLLKIECEDQVLNR